MSSSVAKATSCEVGSVGWVQTSWGGLDTRRALLCGNRALFLWETRDLNPGCGTATVSRLRLSRAVRVPSSYSVAPTPEPVNSGT